MSAQVLIAGMLAFAVVLGAARMLWRLRREDPATRPRAWRTVALLLAQIASAALLYCTLFPPPVAREAGTLIVLTARAAEVVAQGTPGDHVVALPEAPARPGVERVPDLATALRRYPATTRLRVLGAGLVARDRHAVAGRAVDFQPAPLPRGLVELQAPARIPAGRQVAIAGRSERLRGGSIELLDPAGGRVDRSLLADDGRFRLHATTRGAGLALYRLRLRDARAAVVEDVPVPLEVVPARALRVLVLAGAPNAELKYLRRWALDTGMQLDTRISLGAGLQVGTTPVGFDAATLGRFDLVVLDERSWRALGAGQRTALSTAVDRGLGLLLRLTGPITASDRERLRALGFSAVSTGTARETRLGDGFVRAGDAVDALPTLTRSALRIAANDGVVLLDDAAGTPLTVWRARGRGRIGVSTLGDSYRLVLADRGDAHGELWSQAFTTLARSAAARAEVAIEASVPHQRTIVCGIGTRARVAAPDGRQVALRIDPASVDPASAERRCAGFWPQAAGWHAVREGDRLNPFHVRAAKDAPGLAAQALREATQALAAGHSVDGEALQATQPGPRWPWFLAWLLLASALWWLERSRLGQPRLSATAA